MILRLAQACMIIQLLGTLLIINRMGSHLCPDKQLMRDIQQFQKVQRQMDSFIRQCTNKNFVKPQIPNSLLNQHTTANNKGQPEPEGVPGEVNNCKGLDESASDKPFGKVTNLYQIIQQQIMFQDGTKYIGPTKHQLPQGEGEEISANGDRYRGSFQGGRKHGFGICQFHNSDRYEGDFVDNKMCGRGIYYYQNGDRYEGQFDDNQKHGKGTYYLRQPHKQRLLAFEGDYSRGLREGKGKLLCLGMTIQGQWSKGFYRFDENCKQGCFNQFN